RAEPILREAESVCQSLIRDHQGLPGYQLQLGLIYGKLGSLYHDNLAQAEKAEKACLQYLQIAEALVKEHPDVLEYEGHVGIAQEGFGLSADLGGQPQIALARWDKAIEIYEREVSRGVAAARGYLCNSRINRNGPLVSLGEYTRAIEDAEAIARRESLNHTH